MSKQGKTHMPCAELSIKKAKERKDRQKEKKRLTKLAEKENKEDRELANLHRKVALLENSLASSRQKQRPPQSTTDRRNKTLILGTRKHKYNRIEAKRAVKEHLVSLPAMLRQESYSIIHESEYQGTFGSIAVARLTFVNDLVAIKRISMNFSDNLDIMAELRTMHALAGHPRFPYCFGYVMPNLIVMQLLGRYENGTLTVETVERLKTADTKNLCHISCQIVEGISYLHHLGLLHNDIKGNNVIIHQNSVKIIDFGKVTLITNPEIYDLNESERKSYNIKHRYLAHELRNTARSPQTILTDTYSVGYIIKYLGFEHKCDFLYRIGRKMKSVNLPERMSLSAALSSVKEFSDDKF